MSAEESPYWSRTTKLIVLVATMLLVVLVTWRFRGLVGQLVTAAVLAYLLNPVVKFVDDRTPLRRGTLVLLTYFIFIFLVIGAVTALGFALYRQINNLVVQLPQLIVNTLTLIRNWTESPLPILAFGGFELRLDNLDWAALRQQLLSLTEPILSRSGQFASQIVGITLRSVGNFLFVWVISIYMALEIPRLGEYVGRVAQQPGYRRDAERLMGEFGNIWRAYLRGQVILGIIIGFLVSSTLIILGVENALALGLLSGLLEFIPVVGPVIGGGAAIVAAFFQPENYWGLTSAQFALVVLALMVIIQQLENNLLVPRIVGDALDLHPLLVIVGVLMGASIAGVLGAILAAPVLASLKLIGLYAWRKMFDLPPFPPLAEEDAGPVPFRQRLLAVFSPRLSEPALTSDVEASTADPSGETAPPSS